MPNPSAGRSSRGERHPVRPARIARRRRGAATDRRRQGRVSGCRIGARLDASPSPYPRSSACARDHAEAVAGFAARSAPGWWAPCGVMPPARCFCFGSGSDWAGIGQSSEPAFARRSLSWSRCQLASRFSLGRCRGRSAGGRIDRGTAVVGVRSGADAVVAVSRGGTGCGDRPRGGGFFFFFFLVSIPPPPE